MTRAPIHAPSIGDLEDLAQRALDALPEPFRRNLGDVLIRVEDFPDTETEREMELETPFDILGLYRGVDLPHRSVNDLPRMPDMIYLYRRPILDYWCETGEELAHVVRHVLIHEIGHHFGYSDAEMEAIEEGTG